jgi:hypothetical protein
VYDRWKERREKSGELKNSNKNKYHKDNTKGYYFDSKTGGGGGGGIVGRLTFKPQQTYPFFSAFISSESAIAP